MNYIEVEFDGQNRGFRFGLGFLGDILEYFDTDISGYGDKITKNPYKAIPATLYFGHRSYLAEQGKAQDISLLEVEKWIEGLPNTYANEKIDTIFKVVLDSMRKYVPGLAEVEKAKKKSPSTGKKTS